MSESEKGGRPTDYSPAVIDQAFKLALLGATDSQIADIFDISRSTLSLWKTKHPEFSDALKRGKTQADAEIANKLYNRASGFEYVEQQAIKVKKAKDLEEVVIVDVKRVIPPDTTACIFWLKNRQKDQWRDKIEHEHGSDPDKPLLLDVTQKALSILTTEQLEQLARPQNND